MTSLQIKLNSLESPTGREQRTIYLQLEKDAKTGYFGHFTSGLGGEKIHQGRYDLTGNLFRFSPNFQLSVLSNANDVNRPSFGINQFMSLLSSGITLPVLFFLSGGQDGFTRSANGGLNLPR